MELRPRGHDSWVLLAAAVVGRAVADLHDGHHAWDARHFLVTRLREPGNLWGELLGDLRPSPTQVLAAVQRRQATGSSSR
jgi:hypothetical protein